MYSWQASLEWMQVALVDLQGALTRGAHKKLITPTGLIFKEKQKSCLEWSFFKKKDSKDASFFVGRCFHKHCLCSVSPGISTHRQEPSAKGWPDCVWDQRLECIPSSPRPGPVSVLFLIVPPTTWHTEGAQPVITEHTQADKNGDVTLRENSM